MEKNLISGEILAKLLDIINCKNPLQGKRLQCLEEELSQDEVKAFEEFSVFIKSKKMRVYKKFSEMCLMRMISRSGMRRAQKISRTGILWRR